MLIARKQSQGEVKAREVYQLGTATLRSFILLGRESKFAVMIAGLEEEDVSHYFMCFWACVEVASQHLYFIRYAVGAFSFPY
jgi:hypothetical protein